MASLSAEAGSEEIRAFQTISAFSCGRDGSGMRYITYGLPADDSE